MTRNLNRILIVLISSLTLPHTAFANGYEHGVTYDYDEATMNKPTIRTVVETDPEHMSGDTLSTEGSIEDPTVGGPAETSQRHVAYSATYDVSCAPKDGQTIYARGAAKIEGSISAEMANAHGRAAAAAEAEIEIKIGDERAHADDKAAVAIRNKDYVTTGGGFTFMGWGASWTVMFKQHGQDAHSAQLADTDATQLAESTAAVVKVKWSCEHALQIEKTGQTGDAPATGSASASAEAIATIYFSIEE
ncbi:MAG: hypothetical protein ISQ11_07780 [Planctomycetes bacterium]|nr:hypothetical protein [Planctomycetota bacterium]